MDLGDEDESNDLFGSKDEGSEDREEDSSSEEEIGLSALMGEEADEEDADADQYESNDEEDEEDEEDEDVWTASEINKNLVLGSREDATNSSALIENGITDIVSVHDDSQKDPPDGIRRKHFTCADKSDANLLKLMDPAADAVDVAVQRDGKVLVNCLEGRSRSASVVYAYLIKHCKMTLRDAHKLVLEKREMAEPNRGFWRQLVAFERGIRGDASFADEELPGAIMFEQDALVQIIAEHESMLQSQHGQKEEPPLKKRRVRSDKEPC